VTSFSPSSGSIYGGTLITINGIDFSYTPTDNPVLVGSTDCDVITSSPTKITCRTQLRDSPIEDTEDLSVFLGTSEEAVCGLGAGNCLFSWTSTGLPNLSGAPSATFDTTLNEYTITFSGSGFPTSTTGIEVYIDGFA
jgi:hypothetical protein